MTTNMVKTGVSYEVGNILVPVKNNETKTLVLQLNENPAELPEKGMAWVVAKVYTMPDGQPGLKVQRIQ